MAPIGLGVEVGLGARIASTRSLQDLVDEAVRQAWATERNPLRASVVRDPLFSRVNTGDNTPAIRLYTGLGFPHWDTDAMFRR